MRLLYIPGPTCSGKTTLGRAIVAGEYPELGAWSLKAERDTTPARQVRQGDWRKSRAELNGLPGTPRDTIAVIIPAPSLATVRARYEARFGDGVAQRKRLEMYRDRAKMAEHYSQIWQAVTADPRVERPIWGYVERDGEMRLVHVATLDELVAGL
jgi:hypothetical protein